MVIMSICKTKIGHIYFLKSLIIQICVNIILRVLYIFILRLKVGILLSYRDWIDENRVAEVLKDLVRIPSINPSFPGGNGEKEVAAYVKRFFERLKIPYDVQLIEGDRENVIGRLEGSTDTNVMFEAHMDTVQVQGMTIDPFEGRITDGRLYGRGACDTKSSLAAMLVAFETIVKRKVIPPVTIHLAAVVDEETTYKGISFLAKQVELGNLKYDAAIVGEPTNLDIIVAHKGVIRFYVDLQGNAAHTSSPEKGVNAIEHMAEVILQLKEIIENQIEQKNHPLVGKPTLCVTKIEGGIAPNTVADRCRITVDRRTIPGEDPTEVWGEIQSKLKTLENHKPGLKITVQKPFLIDYSMEVPQDHLFVSSFVNSVNRYTKSSRVIGAPYCSDASKLTKVGIPTVVFGPGSIQQAHTKDEWVELEEVYGAAAILIDTVMQLEGSILQT
jgi:acetylornithine deacetylase/succinyl-diaminopimelate desuccinylase family protein